MKNLKTRALFAGMACFAIGLSTAFAPHFGGYSYTIHLNSKLVSEQYLYSKYETPSLVLTDRDSKSMLGVYFNECGQIGAGRKLSARSDQKILKEWSFENSTSKHDPMEFAVKDVSGFLASGRVAIYYTSERVTKPQVLVYLTNSSAKPKIASR